MADIQTTTENTDGYDANNLVGDFDLAIDATEKNGPSPNQVLVADYASCFTFAFRAGAQRNDYQDLGAIRTDAEANIDDEDDLTDISFTMHVEAELTEDEATDLLAKAKEICHVHAALREGLYADVSIESGAL